MAAIAYLSERLTYDYVEVSWNPAESLKTGNALCGSYSALFSLLMDHAEIPNRIVILPEHAWNIVQIDGKWMAVDVTWSDENYDMGDWEGMLSRLNIPLTR